MEKIIKEIYGKRFEIKIPDFMQSHAEALRFCYHDETILQMVKKISAVAKIEKGARMDLYSGLLKAGELINKEAGKVSNNIYEINQLENSLAYITQTLTQ